MASAAGVRVDRDGVRAEDVEERDSVAGRGGPDVGPLGIEDDRDLRRDPRPDPLQGGQPRRPESLVEGEVRLDRCSERPGGLDQQAGEPLDAGDVRREAGRKLTRIGIEAEAQDRAHGSSPGRQPVEVGLRHWGAAEPLAPGADETAGAGVAAGRSSSGTNQPGRDSPSSPETSVRSVMSLTVQSGAVAVEARQLEVDDLAADVEERDRVAGRRPDRRPATRRRWSPAGARVRCRRRGSRRRCRSCWSWSPRCTGHRARTRARGSRARSVACPCPWRRRSERSPARPSVRHGRCGRRAGPCRPVARSDPGGRAAASRPAAGPSTSW